MAFPLVCRGRTVAACGRFPCGNGFGLVYAAPLFVGEAYMPPVRGEQSRVVYGKYGRLSRFVGRGLDPAADVCLMGTFFGKGAKSGSAL